MEFIKKLFRKELEIEPSVEEFVGKYLLELPPCAKYVLVSNPRYGETHYTCEIYIEAKKLLPWSENHSINTCSLDHRTQGARMALPIWLRGANDNHNAVSQIPYGMYEVLRPYILNFINDGIAKIYCLECKSYESNIEMVNDSIMQTRGYSHWIDNWSCSKGHKLYHQEHEMHLSYR